MNLGQSMTEYFAEKLKPPSEYSWRSNDAPYSQTMKPGEQWKYLDVNRFGDTFHIRAEEIHVTKSGRLANQSVFITFNQSEARRLLDWLKSNVEAMR